MTPSTMKRSINSRFPHSVCGFSSDWAMMTFKPRPYNTRWMPPMTVAAKGATISGTITPTVLLRPDRRFTATGLGR